MHPPYKQGRGDWGRGRTAPWLGSTGSQGGRGLAASLCLCAGNGREGSQGQALPTVRGGAGLGAARPVLPPALVLLEATASLEAWEPHHCPLSRFHGRDQPVVHEELLCLHVPSQATHVG